MARHRILFVLLILSWAISWPVIKVGVATVPPIWYACFRYGIATVCLFTFVVVRREAAFPPRSDWPLVAVSGVLQMAVYSALTARHARRSSDTLRECGTRSAAVIATRAAEYLRRVRT